ncbi:diphthamide biosynthesis protein [Hyphopichia burtonii NRRL Y-1933]|uniref:2-(3-amino-3-carboxypropyl)histidine synthase subunit 2 n=1 Tax=Hyphopichia burtonii NRRL Y-1933 TaxID=984485 RepID=A0A1E4RPC9_9ASCO|nr:diphthamide biosynthesis protein [Hyphopichia burtonii NRRL Y-1933]ODV69133.1 diphthamide biosynthesis protein [Hyphopichia burtonii NRRL Y-1933]
MPQATEEVSGPSEGVVAPALSTYQDEDTFQFDKVLDLEKNRSHLGLQESEDYITRINEYYSIDEIVKFLKGENEDNNDFKRITLQFPDSLVCDSASIVHELQKKLGLSYEGFVSNDEGTKNDACNDSNGCCSSGGGACANKSETSHPEPQTRKIWILADTSYSACCIDEVAAEHVQSDLVVHFGDACLNPVDKLPAIYVFGSPRVDLHELVEKFQERYPLESESQLSILLMADAPHTTILKPLYKMLKPQYPNLAYADVYIDPSSKASIIGYEPEVLEKDAVHVLNRTLLHLEDELIDEEDIDATLSQYDLFHITIPETPRLLQLTTRFQSVSTYDPLKHTISQGPYPNLMRRYRYMHMARSAGTVGLLVNTLSLANTKKLINTMAKKLKEAGKKHYIFVVGKPNVAKLANFENVDIWCILGCDHQGIIIDQNNEYFKPIVTPYELMLALNYELSWTGKWVTDFRNILQEMNEEEETEHENENENQVQNDKGTSTDDYEDEAPEFNPVTGQFVSNARPLRRLQHLQITSQEDNQTENNDDKDSDKSLVKKFSSAVAIKNTVSTSAMHLQNRHWTGLGSDWQNGDSDEDASEEGARVEEGRGGVARGYDFDRETHK